jgi:hypothetical protein
MLFGIECEIALLHSQGNGPWRHAAINVDWVAKASAVNSQVSAAKKLLITGLRAA